MSRPKREVKTPRNLQEFVVPSELKKENTELKKENPELIKENPELIKESNIPKEASATAFPKFINKKSKKSAGLFCKTCKKTFPSYSTYTKHFKHHKDFFTSSDKRFLCEDCGKSFSSFNALTEHQNIHRGVKPYKCSECGLESRQASVHLRHISTHKKSPEFKCTICGKLFRQLEYLKIHLRKHNGVKPYTCPHCSKSFSVKTELNRHFYKHSEKRSFACSFCGKSFKMRHNLTAHIKRHTTIVPLWRCKYCNSTFHNRQSYEDHMNVHARNTQTLELYKKNSHTLTVIKASKDKRKVVDYQPFSLPKNVNLNKPNSLKNSGLSLSVNEVLVPLSMAAATFETNDLVRVKISDRFPKELNKRETEEEIKVVLVDENEKPDADLNVKNEITVKEQSIKSEEEGQPVKSSSKEQHNLSTEFINMTTNIESSPFEITTARQALDLIDYLTEMVKRFSQPLPSEVAIRLHSITSRIQRFLILHAPRNLSSKLQQSETMNQRANSIDGQTNCSNSMCTLDECRKLFEFHTILMQALQKHFSTLLN